MFDFKKCQTEMEQIVDFFNQKMNSIRAGRAHPSMLDNVKVEAYGNLMPLNQVANILIADAQSLVITPFDPSTVKAIASAIRNDQSLGFNPSDDGRVVRVPIPPLTEERRREIVKQTHEKVEEAKISIRNARQDSIKEVKRLKDAKSISEDDEKRYEKDIQDLVNRTNEKIEEIFKLKEKELMTV